MRRERQTPYFGPPREVYPTEQPSLSETPRRSWLNPVLGTLALTTIVGGLILVGWPFLRSLVTAYQGLHAGLTYIGGEAAAYATEAVALMMGLGKLFK